PASRFTPRARASVPSCAPRPASFRSRANREDGGPPGSLAMRCGRVIAAGTESWGRYPRVAQEALPLAWVDDPLPSGAAVLPYGMGRSYGDSCLNAEGPVLLTRGLRRFISFDADAGVLRAEAGTTLGEVTELVLGRGWLPPVLPGTQFVTLGGAVANDIH